MKVLVVTAVALCACDKGSPSKQDDDHAADPALAEYARKQAAAAENRPTLDKLPFCGRDPAAEPLAAACRLGQPADRAHFECGKPPLLGKCRAMSIWACRHDALPAVRFEAFLDYAGPPMRDGEAIDTSAIAFTGPVRAVKVHYRELAPAARDSLAKSIRERFEVLGCTDGRCKDFKVKVTSSEYTDEVTVHAWLDGHQCP